MEWTEQKTTGDLAVGDYVRVSLLNPATDRDEVEAVLIRAIRRHPRHGVRLRVEDEDGVQVSVKPERVVQNLGKLSELR